MNYFLDTEFSQLPWDGEVELISIALVCENGRSYSACSNEFDHNAVSEFVAENVVPHLPTESERKSLHEIRTDIASFLTEVSPTSIWAIFPSEGHFKHFGFEGAAAREMLETYGDLDYQLFRKLMENEYLEQWPKNAKNLTPLLSRLQDDSIIPPINEQQHDVLSDANWARQIWLLAKSSRI